MKLGKKTEVDEDADIEESTVAFAGGNLSVKAMTKFLETAFLQNASAGQVSLHEEIKKGGKTNKGGSLRNAVQKAQDKVAKASSSATTAQKGTPLFMNGTYCFC